MELEDWEPRWRMMRSEALVETEGTARGYGAF
jgi:hypothetical protein